jgi:outer membrane protein
VALDLPPRPGEFWLRLDALPAPAPVAASAVASDTVRFTSLAALTEHALRTRAASRAAWLAIQVEAARLDEAEAARWPTLTAQFAFTQSRALSSSGATAPTLHRYGPSLALNYLIHDFGARSAGIEAQRYQLIARLLQNDRVLQDVIAEVEAAAFAVMAARARVDADAEQETALRASLDAVAIRLRGGLASRADELRARAALAEAQRARQLAERDRAKADAALKQAAGLPQTQTLVLDWESPPPPEVDALLADLLAEAERQRPDLRALRAAAGAARHDAVQARAARWPVLALTAGTGRTFFLEDDRIPSSTYNIGVNVTLPLVDGGRLRALARAAEREAERLDAEADAGRTDVARAVVDAYHDARDAQAARALVAVQFDSASESGRAAASRYEAGVGSLLELLTAQADLARARQARAQADTDWLAAFSRLNHALGGLPATPQEGHP